ncbi:TPA: DUF3173 family protein [Streptococcus suis]|uniref:DUF3173 family protein n=1 Tax=Streptococcus iners TaxID=3028084 RepID=A0AA96VN60_9STRE|nr:MULTISPECIES: DUF3173 family protein [Streptococcus]MCK4025682.1 DUF3173 family protein [Streptococcus suis]MDN3007054.1 DUF3173 family protein [Streptococcus suis]MDN3009364.1 DUF3173 family protein [Streptococcus suis]NQF76029.1 DUF3173 family protein [Streptococcus suis]NQK22140.1 DUF3173 family protein [Streptococcus suis]
MKTITHKELMRLGFAKTTARKIIRQAKNIAIKRFEEADKNSKNAVKLSKSPFDNRRLDLAPLSIVEELLGFSLVEYEEINHD